MTHEEDCSLVNKGWMDTCFCPARLCRRRMAELGQDEVKKICPSRNREQTSLFVHTLFSCRLLFKDEILMTADVYTSQEVEMQQVNPQTNDR